MAIEELKSLKETIAEMEQFMNGETPAHITNPSEFGKCIVKVLKELSLRVEEMQRENGLSSAFIDPNDVPHRLR